MTKNKNKNKIEELLVTMFVVFRTSQSIDHMNIGQREGHSHFHHDLLMMNPMKGGAIT